MALNEARHGPESHRGGIHTPPPMTAPPRPAHDAHGPIATRHPPAPRIQSRANP